MQVLEYEFPKSVDVLFVGDLHLGDTGSQYKQVIKYLKKSNSYIVFMGDIIDNALKESITNIYHQKLNPQDQLIRFIEDLKELKSRVLVMLTGNHERRTEKQVGVNFYALLSETLDIPIFDTWGVLDISVKNQTNKLAGNNNRWNYSLCLHHGVVGGRYNERSAKQGRLLEEIVKNCDAYITAHTHVPLLTYQARYVYDSKNKKISKKDVLYATVGGFVETKYAHEKMLTPTTNAALKIIFSDTAKQMHVNFEKII